MKKIMYMLILIPCLSTSINGDLLPEKETMINSGLEESARKEMATQLSKLLSNEYVLSTKTQKYHWNVVGKFFGQLHSLFGTQYEQLSSFIDLIAERIRALDVIAPGTLSEFASQATIKEEPGINPDDTTMVRNLLADHETVIQQLRTIVDLSSKINDMGTNNLLSGLLEKHEKTAWMLRAHLS